ncbi:hypothetical protein F5Y17DRAFT_61105 [Xylariaceae sp. FL0594]|nr:hypothetical protein F5Y17DRAFT_61105 [Xylariaceae sp. FL0594]
MLLAASLCGGAINLVFCTCLTHDYHSLQVTGQPRSSLARSRGENNAKKNKRQRPVQVLRSRFPFFFNSSDICGGRCYRVIMSWYPSPFFISPSISCYLLSPISYMPHPPLSFLICPKAVEIKTID